MGDNIKIEICLEDVESVIRAEKGGADRGRNDSIPWSLRYCKAPHFNSNQYDDKTPRRRLLLLGCGV